MVKIDIEEVQEWINNGELDKLSKHQREVADIHIWKPVQVLCDTFAILIKDKLEEDIQKENPDMDILEQQIRILKELWHLSHVIE